MSTRRISFWKQWSVVEQIFKRNTLMFAEVFLWVHSLFRSIPKWFVFFTYLIWIKIFTVVLQLKLLRLKAISVAEVGICLNKDMVNFAKTNFCGINLDVNLFSQIAKCRFFAWIYFCNLKKIHSKTLLFLKKKKI